MSSSSPQSPHSSQSSVAETPVVALTPSAASSTAATPVNPEESARTRASRATAPLASALRSYMQIQTDQSACTYATYSLENMNTTLSSTRMQVISAFTDAFVLALDASYAEQLVNGGVFDFAVKTLRSPQFRGRAAAMPGTHTIQQMRLCVIRAVALITSLKPRYAAVARSTPDFIHEMLRVTFLHYKESEEIAWWGCGLIANLVQSCLLTNKQLRDRVAKLVVDIALACKNPETAVTALTTIRLLGSHPDGLESLAQQGLCQRVFDHMLTVSQGVILGPSQIKREARLTLAAIQRKPTVDVDADTPLVLERSLEEVVAQDRAMDIEWARKVSLVRASSARGTPATSGAAGDSGMIKTEAKEDHEEPLEAEYVMRPTKRAKTVADTAPEAEPKEAEPKEAEPKEAEPKKAEPKEATTEEVAAAAAADDIEPKKRPREEEPKEEEPKEAEPKEAEPKPAATVTAAAAAAAAAATEPEAAAEPRLTSTVAVAAPVAAVSAIAAAAFAGRDLGLSDYLSSAALRDGQPRSNRKLRYYRTGRKRGDHEASNYCERCFEKADADTFGPLFFDCVECECGRLGTEQESLEESEKETKSEGGDSECGEPEVKDTPKE